MRLTLAQLDPELLEQAAPEVQNSEKLARRADAVEAVFDMCVPQAKTSLHSLFRHAASHACPAPVSFTGCNA